MSETKKAQIKTFKEWEFIRASLMFKAYKNDPMTELIAKNEFDKLKFVSVDGLVKQIIDHKRRLNIRHAKGTCSICDKFNEYGAALDWILEFIQR